MSTTKRYEHRVDPVPIEKLREEMAKIEAEGWELLTSMPMTVTAQFLEMMTGVEKPRNQGQILAVPNQQVIACALLFWKRPVASHADAGPG